MAIFPKVQSPCPYRDQLAQIMDGDSCRVCKRQVVDLNGMDDAGRVAFMQSCEGEVCVSYSFRPVIAAAVLPAAMTALAMAAAAQEPAPVAEDEIYVEVIVGGIKDLANVEYVEEAADQAMADLPVVYDDEAPAEEAAPQDAPKPAKP